MELTSDEKELLLNAAKQSILSVFGEAEKPEIDYKAYPILKDKYGAFVTLKIDNELRGCIGYLVAI
ncbi:MAG: AMMECR1 domain-containing protein, partial [Ignavibacteriaceae bacterium]